MPLFEYRCTNPYCKETAERIDPVPIHNVWCRACSSRMEHIISAPAITKVKGFNASNGYHKPKGKI